ncbi:MAG: class I SAM-dependent methyltransferase, partial [Calditrichota bacterium]
AVKEGDGEGMIEDPLGSELSVYFSWFRENELGDYLTRGGFTVTDRRTREPYPAEIGCRRIFITCEP